MPKISDSPLCYLRFLFAFPTTLCLDVYQGDKLLFKNLLYEDFSPYKALSSGTYTFRLAFHGSSDVLYQKQVTLLRQSIYTLIFAPKYKALGDELYNLFLIEDTLKPISNKHCYLRLGHFYKPTPLISVFLNELNEETPLFKNIFYSQLSSYVHKEANLYTLLVKNSALAHLSKAKPLLLCPKRKFKSGRFYSMYLVGDGSLKFPLHPLFSIDGNAYLSF